ncbi:tyrosine-type recombinase/integrase [Sulfurospirillum multivorans]|uniref:Prophage integrase n=2 Tax=Sulfurospirillum multivorans TaxID=66821 RepID=A0AA86AK13_SULMK|nr:integrase arm-type DNA-binding domain-containing protein [Sulfurospirillum multivorans]AHJ11689.1 putative prophage integrase [Sulfurospirillum multivorans DSM 12446]QEH05189.1 putative prophage integrase [Sulfurospirillum multivorans]
MANRRVAPLNDTLIKTAKPKEKDYTLPDGDGLQLLVKAIGSKVWEVRYTINGKTTKTTIGTYPKVTLANARKIKDQYKTTAMEGLNPTHLKKQAKLEQEQDTQGQFHLVVYDWLKTLKQAPTTLHKKTRNFERDVFPFFCQYDKYQNITSSCPIKEITHSQIYDVVKTKENTSIDTARRLLNDCRDIWLYAIHKGLVETNVIANISRKGLAKYEVTHHPKITDESILKELIQAINNYSSLLTRYALQFVLLNPLRVENLVTLKWEYVDLKKGIITIPRSEMKVKNKNFSDFILPLSTQAVSLMKEIYQLTGWGTWVFHGTDHTQPMNKETCNRALERMRFNDEEAGRRQRTHSFRGTFRSLAETYEQQHGVSEASREACLDHHEQDVKKRAYTHRADYTAQMKILMQWWANFIDKLTHH